MRRHVTSERGAAALVVAISMLVLMGFAALVVDIGAGFNERAQDQSAADAAALAGALEKAAFLHDVQTSPIDDDNATDQALIVARLNLEPVSDLEWQATWEGCTDPDRATINSTFGLDLAPVPSPWSAGNLDCISYDAAGFFRVRIPDQLVPTTFARTIGATELRTSAAAIAQIQPNSKGGILPFAVTASQAAGSLECLSDGTAPLSQPPCDGGETGNYGELDSPLFGNPDLITSEKCTGQINKTLPINVAAGLDHIVTPDISPTNSPLDLDPKKSPSDERDDCGNSDIHILYAKQGNPDTPTYQGLVSGPLDTSLYSAPPPPLVGGPRLQRSSVTTSVFGYDLDDQPLWSFIDSSLSHPAIPNICEKDTFDNSNGVTYTYTYEDKDGNTLTYDGNDESWQHMANCLEEYSGSSPSYSAQLFTMDIQNSPRFAYVPRFWEADLPPGNSEPRQIQALQPTYLQGIWWKHGNTWIEFNPGESVAAPGSDKNWNWMQLTAFLIPDKALPEDLRGSGVDGNSPFTVELYR